MVRNLISQPLRGASRDGTLRVWIFVVALIFAMATPSAFAKDSKGKDATDTVKGAGTDATTADNDGAPKEGATAGTTATDPPPFEIPELPEVKVDIPVSGSSATTSSGTPASSDSAKGSEESTDSSPSSDPFADEHKSLFEVPGTTKSSGAPKAVTTPKYIDRPKPPGFDAGKKLFDQKKYFQAQKVFEKFVQNGTADANTHAYLAVCYFKQHYYSKAQVENEWVAKYAPGEGLRRSASNTAASLRAARSGTCPGGCLKANDPRWAYLPGHSRDKKWISFSSGGATTSFSYAHIGEVIRTINGVPTSMGPCPKCGGAGYLVPLKDGMASPW